MVRNLQSKMYTLKAVQNFLPIDTQSFNRGAVNGAIKMQGHYVI